MATKDVDLNQYLQEKTGASSSGGSDVDLAKYLDEKGYDAPKADDKSGIAQTALEHFGNGAAAKYLPQLQAGTEKAVNAIGDAKDSALGVLGLDKLASVDYQLRKQGFKIPDETYLQMRDQNIARMKKEKADNPITASIADTAGMLDAGIAAAPLLPEAAPAATLAGKMLNGAFAMGKAGATYGALSNPGDQEGKLAPFQPLQRTENALDSGAAGVLFGSGAPLAGAAALKVGNKMASSAEKLAVNATGATGKQASKFAPGAGRELLDRGIVSFGDNQENIARKAGAAVDAANEQIDSSLAKLKEQGVTVDTNKIKEGIQKKINELGADPSQADISKLLKGELDNLETSTKVRGTEENPETKWPITDAENTKRGYNRKAGNWMDPEKGQTGKEMYQAFRGAVEDAAQAADPETAKLFEEGKKSYGLLKPIQEAAERRAMTTNQHPAGGFLDMAATVAGETAGGPVMAIAAPVARRLISPRVASTLASSADGVSKLLRSVPQFAELESTQPNAFKALVSKISSSGDPSLSNVASAPDQAPPTKGPEKWANDGLNNLLQHTDKTDDQNVLNKNKGSMLSDPKTKNLLVTASDLKPGSKAMEDILKRVKAKIGDQK